MTSRPIFLATILLAAAALGADPAPTEPPAVKPAPAPGPPGKGIAFHTTLDAALRIGAGDKKVTVVYFTASWCTWCRKMQVTTFTDPAVLAVSPRFAWAKIDIDNERALAAAFAVRGVPMMAMLNAQGELLAARSGYLTATQLAGWLREYQDKAGEKGEATQLDNRAAKLAETLLAAVKAESKDELRAAVTAAVEQLAAPDRPRGHREEIAKAVTDAGAALWPPLAALLAHERLALRAAAHDLLVTATKAAFPFDAFASADDRAKQAAAWVKWIETAPKEK